MAVTVPAGLYQSFGGATEAPSATSSEISGRVQKTTSKIRKDDRLFLWLLDGDQLCMKVYLLVKHRKAVSPAKTANFGLE